MSQAIEIVLGGLLVGAIYALIAIGFTLVYRVAGVLNLAQGAFVVLGALVFYALEVGAGWPLPLAIGGAVALLAAVGALVEWLALHRALGRLSTAGILILTVGLLTFFEGATLLMWGSQPYAVPSFFGEAPFVVAGIRLPTQAAAIVPTTALVVGALAYTLARTTVGKALRACGENPLAAALMGIDVPRLTLLSYAAAAGLGALGGAVVGPLVSLQFDTGRFFTNAGFIAVALGGMGSFFGAVVGGIALGLVEQLAAGYISSLFAPTISFVLLLAVLLWRPRGMLGARARRIDVPDAFERSVPVIRFAGRRGLLIVATMGLAILIAPLALRGSGLTAALVIAGIFVIAVLGLDLLMGYAGQVSLGHAAFMGIGGYTSAILVIRAHAEPVVAIAAGLAVTLAVALVVSAVTARLRGVYMALATLAVGLLVDSLLIGLPGLTGGPSGLTGIPPFSVAGVAIESNIGDYYLVWGVVGAVAFVLANLARSDFGRALQAIRADPVAAASLGIPVARYKTAAFMLSAACASVAGSLYAFDFRYLAPELVSTPRSLEMVTMLVLGGQGTLVGPVLGAVLITVLPSIVQPLASYKTLVEGAVLVGVLLYLPGGLAGLVATVTRLRPPASWRRSAARS
ncbi:MAG TPA: ABC transporter permease [Candidatus Limnocylindria bacterium]